MTSTVVAENPAPTVALVELARMRYTAAVAAVANDPVAEGIAAAEDDDGEVLPFWGPCRGAV